MKALSFTQPWATLVVTGEKGVETRSWHTNYRGPIFVHASKGFPRWAKDLVTADVFEESLRRHGYRSAGMLPVGQIVGSVEIVNCVPTREVVGKITKKEYEFGDYAEGRFAWILSNWQALSTPVHCTGALGLWNVPFEVADVVEALQA